MKLRQLEFWIATLLVTITLSATMALMNGEGQQAMARARESFSGSGMTFDYVANYFLPRILPALIWYVGFLSLIYIGIPRYLETKRHNAFVTFALILLLVMTALFALNTSLKAPVRNNNFMDEDKIAGNLIFYVSRGMIEAFQFMVLVAGYLAFRQFLVPRLMALRTRNLRVQAFFTQLQVFFFIWVPVIASVFFVPRTATKAMLYIAFCALPVAFLIHAINYVWMIPLKEQRKLSWWKYWPAYLAYTFLLTAIAVFTFTSFVESRSYDGVYIFWITYSWTLILVTPFTWILYRYGTRTTGQLTQLASALSTSNASLDFLKSQINPHFLFNALNTLYGTAIQERSEHTAQGIQKLGDMMRFMLYDNMQDGIPLVKEIQYMRNYIDLQKLRTQASDKIRIDTQLDEAGCQHTVAPMLLIPFVENAFKHGISLIRPSWIKVSLTCTPDKVYFDVYNSRHTSPEKDPEESSSGIGLENVRQRLQLLYPGRHELSIHESQTEYFIHLTLLFPHGKQ